MSQGLKTLTRTSIIRSTGSAQFTFSSPETDGAQFKLECSFYEVTQAGLERSLRVDTSKYPRNNLQRYTAKTSGKTQEESIPTERTPHSGQETTSQAGPVPGCRRSRNPLISRNHLASDQLRAAEQPEENA